MDLSGPSPCAAHCTRAQEISIVYSTSVDLVGYHFLCYHENILPQSRVALAQSIKFLLIPRGDTLTGFSLTAALKS